MKVVLQINNGIRHQYRQNHKMFILYFLQEYVCNNNNNK